MKRTVLVLAGLIALSINSFAQSTWYSPSTGILYTSPTGTPANIGIGIINPAASIHAVRSATGFQDMGIFDNQVNPGNGSTRVWIKNTVAGTAVSSLILQAYGSTNNASLSLAAGIAAAAGSKLLLGAGANMPIQMYSNNNYDFPQFTLGTNGMVGIGTDSPLSKLSVRGSGNSDATSSLNIMNALSSSLLYVRNDGHVGIGGTTPSAFLHINAVVGASDPSSGFRLDYNVLHDWSYGLLINLKSTTPSNRNTTKAFTIEDGSTSTSVSLFNIWGDGTVNAKTIFAEKIEVRTDAIGALPDYVFESDYKLASVYEVEDYVKLNKHLPEVPSAKEMEKDGIDVAKMNAVLLKKIEELTLYIINQQKQLDELKKKAGEQN